VRRFILIVLVLAGIVAAFAGYLVATTPKQSAGVRFPLTESQLDLIGRVPASADAFALIPTAVLLRAKLAANPITRDPVAQWTAEQPIPQPWFLGGADVVAWKSGRTTSYALRVDTVRAFLVRTWLMLSSDIDAQWDGSAFIINGRTEPRITREQLAPVLELAKGLPPGDVFIVQLEGGRGMYPPMARPAVTSASIAPKEILMTSRSSFDEVVDAAASPAQLPKGALIAATFGKPPRLIGELKRVLRVDVASMVENGGTIALYDIDTGTLLPRPRGLVSVPATPESREAMQGIANVAGLVGETRDTGDALLVSFDRESLGLYSKDTFAPLPWPANRWGGRLDPPRLIPVLERLGDNTGLRIAAGRLHRAARDLRQWIRYLEHAESIEAADSAEGRVEVLRVRISSK
jgi:hypothetical protein